MASPESGTKSTCKGVQFKVLQEFIGKAENRVVEKLEEMRKSAADKIDIGEIFEMQVLMNKLVQLAELSTNMVSGLHAAIQAMTRNIK